MEQLSERLSVASMSRVPVRVSAELGRAATDLQSALALQVGEVLDLNRGPDAPVDLYVDGLHYATGHLTVVDGNWAITLDEIVVQPDHGFLSEPPHQAAEPGAPEHVALNGDEADESDVA